MKSIFVSIFILVLGFTAGYFARAELAESREQRNLTSLSGEALWHLDELGKFTAHFSPETIDHRWKEYQEIATAEKDLTALREAWCAWERATIYEQVEKIGWIDYRELIVFNSGRFLSARAHGGYEGGSDFAKKEIKAAEDKIHSSIPAELLAKSGPYY